MPFTFKKSVELKAGIFYLEDRITGNELQAILAQEVEFGRRERRQHQTLDVPFLRVEGRNILLARRRAHSLRATISRRVVTATDKPAIEKARLQGLSWSQLHIAFPGYSVSTLRRVVSGIYEEADAKLVTILAQSKEP